DHRNRLRSAGLQHNLRTLHMYPRRLLIEIGSKLLLRDGRDFGAYPSRFDKQRVNIGHRLDAPADHALEVFGRIGLRKVDDRLDVREDVLASMLRFASQNLNVLLISLLLCDISCNLRCSDDPSFGILYGRNGQRDSDEVAVLAFPNSLKMIDPLPSPDASQNLAFFVVPLERNDRGDGPTDRLLRGVAEKAFRTPVPAADDAVQVLADDRIVTGLDHRADPPQALLALAQRRFGVFALGDVDAGRMQEHHRPRRVPNRMHREVHDPLPPITQPVR